MDKRDQYQSVAKEIAAVLEGETNLIARMATVVSMLIEVFGADF